MASFTELLKTILKFGWNNKEPQTAKANLGKKNKAEGTYWFQTKLQSYHNFFKVDTGIKIDTQRNGTELRA